MRNVLAHVPGRDVQLPASDAGTELESGRRGGHAAAAHIESNAAPARHMACSTTAILRATATAARLKPSRFLSARPQRRPEAFLRDTLSKIADGHPIGRIDELMPWKHSSPRRFTASEIIP